MCAYKNAQNILIIFSGAAYRFNLLFLVHGLFDFYVSLISQSTTEHQILLGESCYLCNEIPTWLCPRSLWKSA